jgi:acetyl-CoA carboxylase biotin carboxyl carrier protein
MNYLKMEIDKKIIRKLIEVLEDLKKSLKDNDFVNIDDPVAEEIDVSKIVIKSPIVGTVYLAREPGAKKFVEVGKKIKKGDSVIIVEAMKTMNHVTSTSDGVVKEICVEDGQPVEFGQKLIVLE